MKIPLIYPKIPESGINLKHYVAFEKYDGTNLHWCWNKNDGWDAFGTRRTQFDFTKSGIEEFQTEHPELFSAPIIFNDVFRDKLNILFCSLDFYRDSKIIVFTEFLGPNSFAGTHSMQDFMDDTQQLVMIDVLINNQIIDPYLFLEDFSSFPIARVVSQGLYNGQFFEDVRKGKYLVNEGVVCKGIIDYQTQMFKIKTKNYLKRLEKR